MIMKYDANKPLNFSPIIKLKTEKPTINLYAKLAFLNLTGSIKDKVAAYMISQLKKEGKLKDGQLIVEASSGNMGAALAVYGRNEGHPVYITVPQKTGRLKIAAIQRLGAKVIVCPESIRENDPKNYVNTAKKIAREHGGYFINQYDNPLNEECHYFTTGLEIVEFCQSNKISLDYFITVGGSGGTITGSARRIKETYSRTKVIMPDPYGSIYHPFFKFKKIEEGQIHPYQVEGPGNPIFCKSMNLSLIDDIIQFSDEEAFEGCASLAKDQGIHGGHSAGANYHTALKLINSLPEGAQANILILIPDTGLKYSNIKNMKYLDYK
ncbi:cysteine synthase family protein [Francisellaceae bacterium]|nr:cysteine synthase family protein [Francisellaceae bacterium]